MSDINEQHKKLLEQMEAELMGAQKATQPKPAQPSPAVQPEVAVPVADDLPEEYEIPQDQPAVSTYPICCKDVSISFSGNKILKNISVRCNPGQITAILGPSGSGKSTLLKCFTSIYDPDKGKVYIAGNDLDKCRDEFRKLLGYVPQDDIIHKELSIAKALYYAARLRLSTDISDKDIDKRCEAIMRKLGLSQRKNVRIKRLSGGQRKRVNIATELLADPSVLILDEPASGLDPATEEDLIILLQQLAAEQKTVLMTTHSMQFLHEVDVIIFLIDGYLAFAGNLEEMLSYFQLNHIADIYKELRDKNPQKLAGSYRQSHYFQKYCGGAV